MKAREIISWLRLRLGRRRKELVRRRRRMLMRWSTQMEGVEFVYLVFRQHLCRVNLTRLYLCPENPPPIETLLFFPEKDLPVGMGAFCYKSQIYLMGGEKLREGQKLVYGKSFAPELHHSLNCNLFLLDQAFCQTSADIPPTIGPKPGAKAVIIDGKIYAFAGMQYCFRQVVPSPKFECYDPSLGSWEALPDPPFFDDDDKDGAVPLNFLNVSVLGRRIFVDSAQAYLVYDVDRREWHHAKEYISLKLNPFEFFGSITEYEDYGIFVAYTVEGLVAYSDATLTRYQHLLPHLNNNNNNSLFPCPDPNTQFSFIRYLGGGIFCFVLTVLSEWDIHVTTFLVSPVSSQTCAESETNLLESRLLAHHVYNTHYACDTDFDPPTDVDIYPPTDVFTMCQRSKRHKHGGLYRFGVGRRFKRQAKLDRKGNRRGGARVSII